MKFKPPWVWIREDWEAKQRRFQDPGAPRSAATRWITRIAMGIAILVVAPVVLIMLGFFLLIVDFLFINTPVQTPMTVPVNGSTVVLERRSAHIFLGEYERAVIVQRGGTEIGRAELILDIGGGARMNVYQIDDNTLVLHDRFGPVALQLSSGRLGSARELPSARLPGTFLGAFDRVREGTSRTYRFVPAAERAPQPISLQTPENAWPPLSRPPSRSQPRQRYAALPLPH